MTIDTSQKEFEDLLYQLIADAKHLENEKEAKRCHNEKLMDERIPAEVKNRLLEPLKPTKNPAGHPIAPPRPRQRIQRQELLTRFDPYAPQIERCRTVPSDEALLTKAWGQ